MPRKPRTYLADLPCHVVQRDNNRDACFFTDDDWRFYREALSDACRRYRVAVHVYILNDQSGAPADGASDSGGYLARDAVAGLAHCEVCQPDLSALRRPTGKPAKASLVDAQAHLPSCYRHIESLGRCRDANDLRLPTCSFLRPQRPESRRAHWGDP